MFGKGLESLIPKKSGGGTAPSSFQTSQTDISEEKKSESTHQDAIQNFPKEENNSIIPNDRVKNFPRERKNDFGVSGVPGNRYQKIRHFNESVFHIEVDRIKSNPFQPRSYFDEENLQELAQSIREFGIIQPLVVSKVIRETETGTQVEYQLIAGERRLMAAKLAGLERVPAIVRKVQSDREKLELALIENIQRSNLNPIESAKAYSRLQDEFGLTQREIAARVGKSREVVANTLRLLNLPSKVQDAIMQNKISESQARALLAALNFEEQEKMFQDLMFQKSGIRGLRERTSKPVDPENNYWEKQLEEKLGAPVKVIKQGNKGRMVIQFYSEDEWNVILKRLLGDELDSI